MKKAIFLIVASVVLIISCSPKTTSTTNPKTEVSQPTVELAQPIVPAVETPSSTDMVAVGQKVYETKCNKCHGLKNTGNYTEVRWKEVLEVMAPKANLTPDETQQVAAYVNANAKK